MGYFFDEQRRFGSHESNRCNDVWLVNKRAKVLPEDRMSWESSTEQKKVTRRCSPTGIAYGQWKSMLAQVLALSPCEMLHWHLEGKLRYNSCEMASASYCHSTEKGPPVLQ